jgi:hypothetical protein
MNYEEIYPSIVVYKNVIEDIDELYDLVVKSETEFKGDFIFGEWIKWFVFGTYVNVNNHVDQGFLSTCHQNLNDDESRKKEIFIYEKISNATQRCIDHYVQSKNIKVPENSYVTKPNIAKYIRIEWLDDGRDSSWEDLAMQFHTDYEIGKWFQSSRQFLLTANLYINDDYDGGEIIFLHNGNLIPYKPIKGDLIVFPSGSPLYPEEPNRDPYFHAVGLVSNGEKFFTRSYIQYETENQPYFYEMKEHFPSDEDFNQEIERINKLGMNTIGVFFGLNPFTNESIPFSLKKYNKFKDKNGYYPDLWISAHTCVEKLYDIKFPGFFYRDENDWHRNKDGSLCEIVDQEGFAKLKEMFGE